MPNFGLFVALEVVLKMGQISSEYNLVTILGPTASGKTAVAAHVAALSGGEIISADSRQVYRRMNLGTGKDYNDYLVNGIKIPYHLVDITEPGYQYNVFEYQQDFLKVFNDLNKRGVFPVLCGGSGMYIEAVLKGYKLVQVPHNSQLRTELEKKSLDDLIIILKSYKPRLHNITDIVNKKRAVRAIEIEAYCRENPQDNIKMPEIRSLVIGINYDRLSIRQRITSRLQKRLDEGMVDEVRKLLDSGITPDELAYYGLEYKYLTMFLTGELTYDEMFRKLNTAIHRFAKRQMTWFRRMERQGTIIHWLDGYMPLEIKTKNILSLLLSE